jgi:hypothetical protein
VHTILLLTISNIFMTIAWYGHLKYKDSPLWIAILVSWGLPSSSTVSKYRPTDWALLVFGCATEDDPGSDHAGPVLRFLDVLSQRAAEVELLGWVCLDGRRRVRDL